MESFDYKKMKELVMNLRCEHDTEYMCFLFAMLSTRLWRVSVGVWWPAERLRGRALTLNPDSLCWFWFIQKVLDGVGVGDQDRPR